MGLLVRLLYMPERAQYQCRRGLNNYEHYDPIFLIKPWYQTLQMYLKMILVIVEAHISFSLCSAYRSRVSRIAARVSGSVPPYYLDLQNTQNNGPYTAYTLQFGIGGQCLGH